MLALRLVLSVGFAYLLGSVPFGVWICQLQGRDPRLVGSGRTGGTNVYRTAGWRAAALTIGFDIAKGYAAVALARLITSPESAAAIYPWAVSLAGLAAILGHNHSIFLGFRGGAGSTANVGAVLALDPALFAFGLAMAGAVLLGVRIASVTSIALSTVVAIGLGWRVIDGALPPQMLTYAIGQLVLVLWALRPNLQRLRNGSERRIELTWRSRAPDGG